MCERPNFFIPLSVVVVVVVDLVCCCCLGDRVPLCSHDCPGTSSVAQTGLELSDLPTCASQVWD